MGLEYKNHTKIAALLNTNNKQSEKKTQRKQCYLQKE